MIEQKARELKEVTSVLVEQLSFVIYFTDLPIFLFYPEENLESLGRKSENIVKNYSFLAENKIFHEWTFKIRDGDTSIPSFGELKKISDGELASLIRQSGLNWI